MKFEFDYSKLRGRIVEKYESVEKFSKALGATSTTLGRKLSGKSAWSQDEIAKACNLLDISTDELTAYFFYEKG